MTLDHFGFVGVWTLELVLHSLIACADFVEDRSSLRSSKNWKKHTFRTCYLCLCYLSFLYYVVYRTIQATIYVEKYILVYFVYTINIKRKIVYQLIVLFGKNHNLNFLDIIHTLLEYKLIEIFLPITIAFTMF